MIDPLVQYLPFGYMSTLIKQAPVTTTTVETGDHEYLYILWQPI